MINKIINWVKTHQLLTVAILVALWFLGKWLINIPRTMLGSRSLQYSEMESFDMAPTAGVSNSLYKTREATPQPDVTDRKVVVNSNFSLLVKNVTETVEMIKQKTLQIAGYMVNTNISRSEYGENAVLTIRIPSERVDEMSKYLRTIAVKVVSENVDGRDITDQYIDIERRLGDLEAQRARMMAILDRATTVREMLDVQNAIDQIQNQIDSYKGQLQYMDGTTKTSKLTVYVSTDELGLPYTPQQTWRPQVIFKQAVRAMLATLQQVGTAAIWIAVYLPIIAGVLLIVVIIRKATRKKQEPKL